MLLFSSIILGLIVGLIRKGNIFRLNNLRLLWLVIMPLFASLVIKYYPVLPYILKAALTTLTYSCVIAFVIANRENVVPSVFLGLGTLSNYVVIAANSFRMPITAKALLIYPTMTAEAVLSQRANYFVATDGAKLMSLGDIIYIPIKIIEGFISVGDILLAIGMFLLIVRVMGKNTLDRKKPADDVK